MRWPYILVYNAPLGPIICLLHYALLIIPAIARMLLRGGTMLTYRNSAEILAEEQLTSLMA